MLALRLRQATAGILVIGILLAFLGFCALIQVSKVMTSTKNIVIRGNIMFDCFCLGNNLNRPYKGICK